TMPPMANELTDKSSCQILRSAEFQITGLPLLLDPIEHELWDVHHLGVADLAIARAKTEDVRIARNANQMILGRGRHSVGRHSHGFDLPAVRHRSPDPGSVSA